MHFQEAINKVLTEVMNDNDTTIYLVIKLLTSPGKYILITGDKSQFLGTFAELTYQYLSFIGGHVLQNYNKLKFSTIIDDEPPQANSIQFLKTYLSYHEEFLQSLEAKFQQVTTDQLLFL
jgi:hypothetical protein